MSSDVTQNSLYELPQPDLWKGRQSDEAKGVQYWYQAIRCGRIDTLDQNIPEIAFVGYACDEGVRRNLGRVGAKDAPKLFRQQLAKLPFHLGQTKVTDVGDVTCLKDDLESCQLAFSKIVAKLIAQSVFTIAIGGGHDIAYAHFAGIWEGLKNQVNPKIGIINFDAHFDLRPYSGQGTSGTPFHQILTQHGSHVSYLVLGIQPSGNTPELFDIANEMGVSYLTNLECMDRDFDAVQRKLDYFLDQVDYVYISIDMDGFSSAYAPGVSAPSPLGFDPHFAMRCLQYILDRNQVIACDIAEANPNYDQGHVTLNLAARIADFIASTISKES